MDNDHNYHGELLYLKLVRVQAHVRYTETVSFGSLQRWRSVRSKFRIFLRPFYYHIVPMNPEGCKRKYI